MARMTMIQALRSAMDVMLERDPNVVVYGQDVGYFGGVFRCTEGLQAKYGKSRVFDAPISEGGIVGSAIGMAAYGLRPVVEVQFADYFYPASDQIVSEAARLRYRSAGDFTAPLTIRMPCGGGIYGGQTHSQSPEALFTHVCGLRTVMPSNPYDAKGLLIASHRERRPGDLPGAQAPVQRPLRRPPRQPGGALVAAPDGRGARGPLHGAAGHGRVFRPGSEVTVLTYGTMVFVCEAAARKPASTPRSSTCAASGRWTWPPSWPRCKKTGRCVIVHEATRTSGFGAELARWCRSTASTTWKRPSNASPAGTRPTRTRWNGPTSPGPARVAAALRARMEAEMAVHVIKVPDLGEGIAEVELVAWHVQPGDTVAEDQALADVMTDKASVEIPSPVAGRVLAGRRRGPDDGRGRGVDPHRDGAEPRPSGRCRQRQRPITTFPACCAGCRQRPPVAPASAHPCAKPAPAAIQRRLRHSRRAGIRVRSPRHCPPRCAAAPGNMAWT
jgi:2-oxoisovalerate dehydrogenase E1 component beta subunit